MGPDAESKCVTIGGTKARETKPEPARHDVTWTPERIKRFWDFQSSSDAMEDEYFSKLRGRALIDFVARRIRIGSAFDMGCGRGDLIGYLLGKHEAGGADQSPESVAATNRKFEGHPRFRGAFVGTDEVLSELADTVFIVEVVEHLDDATLDSVLKEARRLLKPGGHLVLTTPNEENLQASQVMCPECACVFHRWQHVRSWTPDSLAKHVSAFGFEGTAVATLLSQYAGFKRLLQRAIFAIRGDRLPHMVYIGTRRD